MKAPKSAITGDLGMSIANSAFARAGFAFRAQTQLDFGIDALAELVVDEQATGQLLAIQVKSGASQFRQSNDSAFVFRPPHPEHVAYWLDYSLPVIVCLVDTETDTVYWQAVTDSTVESTGASFKVLVPRSQMIQKGTNSDLEALATPIVPAQRYTIVEHSDVSTGRAKRYRVKVVLNGNTSKAEAATVVRQVTSEVAHRAYNRSDIAAQRWGNSEADIVWTFVYPSISDLHFTNWICRSEWIIDDLPASARPIKMKGEELGDGLTVSWSTMYDEFARLQTDHELSKGDYLAEVDNLLPDLQEAHTALSAGVQAVRAHTLVEADFIDSATADLRRIEAANDQIATGGAAPYECADVDLKLIGFVNHMHNVVLYFTSETFLAREPSNRLWLAADSLSHASADLADLEYELKKVR